MMILVICAMISSIALLELIRIDSELKKYSDFNNLCFSTYLELIDFQVKLKVQQFEIVFNGLAIWALPIAYIIKLLCKLKLKKGSTMFLQHIDLFKEMWPEMLGWLGIILLFVEVLSIHMRDVLKMNLRYFASWMIICLCSLVFMGVYVFIRLY